MLASFIDFKEGEILITFILIAYWIAGICGYCSSKQYFKYGTYCWYSWCNIWIWVKCESEIWTLQIVMISGNFN